MSYEHSHQEGFPFITKEGIHREKERFELHEPESLPIYDIIRIMTHEKFILSWLIVIGIVKFLIIGKIFQVL